MKQSINITMQGQPSKIKKLFSHTEFIILLATVVLMLASYFVNNAFFSQYNMSTLLRQMSFVTIVAFGQTMILILGDIDLSVGATAGLSAITAAILMAWLGLPPQLTFVLCIVLGALCGLFNGFFVTKFRITPFIITLGSSYIFEGIIYVITEGRSITNIGKLPVPGTGNGWRSPADSGTFHDYYWSGPIFRVETYAVPDAICMRSAGIKRRQNWLESM